MEDRENDRNDKMNEESDRYRVGLSDPMFTAASGTRFAYRYSFLVSLVSLVTLLPTLPNHTPRRDHEPKARRGRG